MDNFISVLATIGVIIIIILLSAFPLMLLWNWLMPHIFGLTTINFWQSLGLCLMGSILFKGSK